MILSPSQAAERLGIPVATLVAILRRGRYEWTELAPGGRPGDRGRARWGLTEAQFQRVIAGQRRGYAEPSPVAVNPVAVGSPDGKSRLRKGRLKR